MPSQTDNLRSSYMAVAGLLVLIAVVRVVSTYSHTAQGFDEPCHAGAAIELLDKHTYTLDPVHPPLARIAIGLPLYLSGERYPNLSLPDLLKLQRDGNAILNTLVTICGTWYWPVWEFFPSCCLAVRSCFFGHGASMEILRG